MLKKLILLLLTFNISVTMDNNNLDDSEIFTENFYSCHLCPLKFTIGLDLSNHLKNSHQICAFCLLKFENTKSVSNHEEHIHHFI